MDGGIDTVTQLEDLLSEPTPAAVEALRQLPGDVLVLGVAGKMGPTLARMAQRAATDGRRIIGVSRFSDPSYRDGLEKHGVETIQADLLDPEQVEKLPQAPNVVYMAGRKFGSTGNESLTWAMNAHLPALICRKFADSRIAAFSTGNVYSLCPAVRGGSVETDAPGPIGEYAMSCLGRERIFEHFSRTLCTRVSILRLNYACELRYGVLVDIAQKIWRQEAIDLSMGAFNVIWQGDASAMALASLLHADSPPFVVNVAGPELVSVRRTAEHLGQLMGKPVHFEGEEAADALLSNGQRGHRLYGYPRVGVEQMIRWIAAWVMCGGASLDKPTHFETRDGKF